MFRSFITSGIKVATQEGQNEGKWWFTEYVVSNTYPNHEYNKYHIQELLYFLSVTMFNQLSVIIDTSFKRSSHETPHRGVADQSSYYDKHHSHIHSIRTKHIRKRKNSCSDSSLDNNKIGCTQRSFIKWPKCLHKPTSFFNIIIFSNV